MEILAILGGGLVLVTVLGLIFLCVCGAVF